MKLWVFIVRRLILLIPILIGVMTITFVLLSSMPLEDQLAACAPINPHQHPPPTMQQRLHECGLDAPIWDRYAIYIGNIFTLNWGYVSPDSCLGVAGCIDSISGDSTIGTDITNCFTMYDGVCPANALIGAWLPYTIELALFSLFLIILISLPLGTYSAVKRNRPFDQATRVFSFSGFALPGFLLGNLIFIAIYFAFIGTSFSCGGSANIYSIFGSWPPQGQQYGCMASIHWTLPSGLIDNLGATHPTHIPLVDAVWFAITNAGPTGDPYVYWWIAGDSFIRLLFPAFVIAIGSIAYILRFVRNSTLEVMNQDYVRTARAKGVSEHIVISRHAGRTSLNATVTVLGLTFAYFMTGFVVLETVFGLYGVGRLFTFAIVAGSTGIDPGVITASTLFFAVLVVIANMIVDILYAYLDPRVRIG